MQLASSFHYRSPVLRSASPLSDDQIRTVAPSIFAIDKHDSRSDRYTYIPTIDVLMVCVTKASSPSWSARPACVMKASANTPNT
jgi:hypothetical protein